MNKEVYDLLKDASEDAKKIRKRKDNAIAKEKKLKEAFYNRAIKNGEELSNKLFKSLIEEYTNDPISVLNFWGSKTEKKYFISYPLFKSDYKLPKEDQRLRYYFRGPNNPCCFIIDEKTNELQKYLNSLNRNNQIAYIELYKKLLKKYKLHPNDKDIEVTINIDKAKDLDNPYAVLFNEASSDDSIFNFPYKDNYNIIKCVPVQFSALRKMFRDDMDIGYCNIYLGIGYLYVSFNMLELEKALLNIEDNEKKLTL